MYSKRVKQISSLLIVFLLIPLTLYIGVAFLGDRKYYFISIFIMLLACLPLLLRFERRKPQPREIIVIAVMSAISVIGRAVFIVIPGFKPVTAITAITGFALGAEAGFLTGATSAFASNILFGQGPWTPFQMFFWGMTGYIAGLFSKKEKLYSSKWFIVVFSVLSAILFSFGMDVWGVISLSGVFEWKAYLAALVTAVPFTIIYISANLIFLFLLQKPFIEKLNRLKVKYGIFL